MTTVVIVPCGSAKVWDKRPNAGPTEAREAYSGTPFVLNRQYAEQFGDRWVILSAKYGIIQPEFVIPGPYNVTLKRKQTKPIGLGGKEYRAAIEAAFSDRGIPVRFPFAGLPLGKMLQATRRALDAPSPSKRG